MRRRHNLLEGREVPRIQSPEFTCNDALARFSLTIQNLKHTLLLSYVFPVPHASPLSSALQLTSAGSTMYTPVAPASRRRNPTSTARLRFICHCPWPRLAPPTISQKAATFADGPKKNVVPESGTAIGVGEPETCDSMKSEEMMLRSSEMARRGSSCQEQTKTLYKRV